MIKINLIQQRKVRTAEPGQNSVLAGLGGAILLAVGIFLFVHGPIADKIETLTSKNNKLKQENATIKKRTSDYKDLQAAVTAAEQQKLAIEELNAARAVPAWLLHEMAVIFTPEGRPTMTDAMARRVRDDPNRSWAEGWDPKNVWIRSFAESGGFFRLEGSARSDSDMTQLALRLQASAYFDRVVPEGGSASGSNSVSIYKFTISGRVRY